MDFSKVLIHSSSVGKLFVEPKSKADKEANELSATAKTHLIEIYAELKYGRKKELDNKYIRKGNAVENNSLLLLSESIGEFFDKNEEQLQNNFICGTPDTFSGEKLSNANVIYDVKSSFDIFSFMSNMDGELDRAYYYQLQSYIWLSGATHGFVVYCLVDNTQEAIESEKQYLMRKINVISEESPEFKKEWAKKEKLLIYSDIPEQERILMFKVEKDPYFVMQCQQKVVKARLFLQELEQNHLSFNKNNGK